MQLSILIPSLVNRKALLSRLIRELEHQIKPFKGQVEIVTYIDNKEHSTGFKRNKLVEQATGKYICFIDDDDTIFPSYISSILKGCETDADCLGIKGIMYTNKLHPVRWEISKDFKDENVKKNGRLFYKRHSNHLSPVRRSIAIQCKFPDKSNAEDSFYSNLLRESGLLVTEYKVEPLVYKYMFQNHSKEYK